MQKRAWIRDISLYTVAGAAAATAVGTTVSIISMSAFPPSVTRLILALALGLAVVGIARSLGWSRFRLPRVKRQTRDVWARRYAPQLTAILWGIDIGLTFQTRLTFAGAGALGAAVAGFADPLLGASIFVSFWIGRALPVWLSPLLMDDANSTPVVLDAINRQERLFLRFNVAALAALAALLAVQLA